MKIRREIVEIRKERVGKRKGRSGRGRKVRFKVEFEANETFREISVFSQK